MPALQEVWKRHSNLLTAWCLWKRTRKKNFFPLTMLAQLAVGHLAKSLQGYFLSMRHMVLAQLA